MVLSFAFAFAAGCGGGGSADVFDALDDVAAVDVVDDPGAGDITTDEGRDTINDAVDAIDAADAGDALPPDDADDAGDTTEDTAAPYWTDEPFDNDFPAFNRGEYEKITGWILLDSDRASILSAIETAATYGVNHIQLSHDIIMDIDELLGDDQATVDRVETINQAIAAAHLHGMKVFVWAHEFQDMDFLICYGPDGAIWETRAQAYRDAFEKVPDLDGVILMFGSAGASPWYTLCDCEWCLQTFPDQEDGNPPPQDVRIQLTIEHIGDVMESLGKEMVARVFAHEPEENPWHADGLARARDTTFVSMHKSEVGDWQPYNPHDPTLGQVGAHPSILEMDAAGEYFGRSELPFASPQYYRYRLKHAFDRTAIGAVARISRGSDTALGTPNEINLRTINAYVADPGAGIDKVWQDFLLDRYLTELPGPGEESFRLQAILETTLPVMMKTHYVLGIWALEKGSDIPASATTGELGARGNMPKWDADWQEIYDRVKTPDYETVLDIFNEGTEAVMVAERAFNDFAFSEWNMTPADYDDLYRRLKHQYFAARAWRGVELYIFAVRAAVYDPENAGILRSFAAWAIQDLQHIADEMGAAGLTDVSICSPAKILQFVVNVDQMAGYTPTEPPSAPTRPIYFSNVGADSLDVSFERCLPGKYAIEYGTEFPHYDHLIEIDNFNPPHLDCANLQYKVEGLSPDTRYFFRVKIVGDDETNWYGGDFWEMTRMMP